MKGRVCKLCRKPIPSEEMTPNRRYHRRCFPLSRKKYLRERIPMYRESRRRAVGKYATTEKGRKVHKRASAAYQRVHKESGLCQRCPNKVYRGGLCRPHWDKWKRWYEGRKRERAKKGK